MGRRNKEEHSTLPYHNRHGFLMEPQFGFWRVLQSGVASRGGVTRPGGTHKLRPQGGPRDGSVNLSVETRARSQRSRPRQRRSSAALATTVQTSLKTSRGCKLYSKQPLVALKRFTHELRLGRAKHPCRKS